MKPEVEAVVARVTDAAKLTKNVEVEALALWALDAASRRNYPPSAEGKLALMAVTLRSLLQERDEFGRSRETLITALRDAERDAAVPAAEPVAQKGTCAHSVFDSYCPLCCAPPAPPAAINGPAACSAELSVAPSNEDAVSAGSGATLPEGLAESLEALEPWAKAFAGGAPGIHMTRILTAARSAQGMADELADLKRERQARNAIDPSTRLHNLCDALAENRGDSPYTQEAWDAQDAAYRAKCDELARVRGALRNVLDHLSFHDEEGLIEHAEPMIAARAALAASAKGET